MGYWSATGVLTLKNFRLLIRDVGPLAVAIFGVLFSMFVLFLSQKSFDNGDGVQADFRETTNPSSFSLNTIPRCVPGAFDHCFTLAYVPNNDVSIRRWVENVARKSGIPIDKEVISFRTSEELNQFLVRYPNRTQAAYIFEKFDLDAILKRDVSFVVQYNTSDQYEFPLSSTNFHSLVVAPAMAHAMNSEIMPGLSGKKISISMNASKFPHPTIIRNVNGAARGTANAFLLYGPLLLFAVYFLVVVTFMSKLIFEKERGLKDAMKLAGMSQSQHYLSWLVPFVLAMLLDTFGIIAFGHIFRFKFFTETEFSVYFLTLFIFALSLVGWAFLISTFVNRSRTVSVVGFQMFIFGYMLGTAGIFVYQTRADGTPLIAKSSIYWRYILAIFPSTMFMKSITDLTFASVKGFPLSFEATAKLPKVFSVRTCWVWMIVSGLVAFLISIYLDNVLPSIHGSSLPPHYFLLRSYWKTVFGVHLQKETETASGPQDIKTSSAAPETNTNTDNVENDILYTPFDPNTEDDVVRMEREQVMNGSRDGEPLVVKSIVRRFKELTAVDNVSFSVSQNTAFACLGHNGAGKSTLFKMLVTSIGVSEGDAFVYGKSVRQDQSEIRRMLGVCQQHDALWDLLSGEEHIDLFAALKGLGKAERKEEIRLRLLDVGLESDGQRYAGTYSGGMQRRLSVAISLTGNPKILLLDECTTGADPLVRRDLWATIERAKKRCIVFLITHSMAEAERLGDTIGIMAKGKLRVLGSALHLKNKFGAGYRVVTTLRNANTAERLESRLSELCSGTVIAKVTQPDSGEEHTLAEYSLPRNLSDEVMSAVVQMFEDDKEGLGILQWTIDSATLDEVFKSITSLSEDVIEDEEPNEKGFLSCLRKMKRKDMHT